MTHTHTHTDTHAHSRALQVVLSWYQWLLCRKWRNCYVLPLSTWCLNPPGHFRCVCVYVCVCVVCVCVVLPGYGS